MGVFNSIFWAIYMGSALVGDLFGAFVIAEVNETVFYLVMTSLCVLASLFFLLLGPPTKVSDSQEKAEHVSLRSVVELMFTKRMLTVVPLFMTSGLCVAGNAAIFVPLLEMTMDDTEKSKLWSDQIKS